MRRRAGIIPANSETSLALCARRPTWIYKSTRGPVFEAGETLPLNDQFLFFPVPATLSARYGASGPHTPYPPLSRPTKRERGGSEVVQGDSAAAKPPQNPPPSSCAPRRRAGRGFRVSVRTCSGYHIHRRAVLAARRRSPSRKIDRTSTVAIAPMTASRMAEGPPRPAAGPGSPVRTKAAQ